MFKLGVFTSTRAEYGLLQQLISLIEASPKTKLQLIVTGTHLSHDHGYTLTQIVDDGFTPDVTISIDHKDDSPNGVTRAHAQLLMSLAEYFDKSRPDVLILLGDRAELLSASHAAVLANIPIVHIHGGETTEGAIDDKIRHAITKLSNYHFASTSLHSRRIIQLGENRQNVVVCGALGTERIGSAKLFSKQELSVLLSIPILDRYLIVLYHPETISQIDYVDPMIKSLSNFPELQKIVIYPNADVDNRKIMKKFISYQRKSKGEVYLLDSVPRRVYLSLLKHSEVLVGNSSSGIIEAPSLNVPVVNIGNRQKGRIKSSAIIDVGASDVEITEAIESSIAPEASVSNLQANNPYGSHDSSNIIFRSLMRIESNIKRQKPFIDLEGAL